MNKDAPAIPANEPDSDIFAIAARRKACVLIVVLGAGLGLLVGILNLLAMYNEWPLQDYFFDIVDAPVLSLMSSPDMLVSILRALGLWLVLICYWEIISLFLASLVCLVHTRVIRDIIRDKICRYNLFFGACGGNFVGGLSFLAASSEWKDLENCFNILNEPVSSVMSALQEKYSILDSLQGSGTDFIVGNTVAIVYWIVIGLLLALFACVVRILRKRKAAKDTQAFKGMILLCRSGVSEQASK